MEQWHVILAVFILALGLTTLHCTESFMSPVGSMTLASLTPAQKKELDRDIKRVVDMLIQLSQEKCRQMKDAIMSIPPPPPGLADYIRTQVKKRINATKEGKKVDKFLEAAAQLCQ